jgi:hypothetical protein
MDIPVDKVEQVTAARCLSCLNCVDACPARTDGAMVWGPPPRWGRRWSHRVLVGILLSCTAGAVVASYAFPLPSFVSSRGDAPEVTAAADLEITGLTCRGSANLLVYFLERDDVFALRGYLKLEAWPGPGAAPARVTFDPAQTDESAIKQAITEPYYDAVGEVWRFSPFVIEGYDPLGINDDAEGSED